jgi:hypothetical protein
LASAEGRPLAIQDRFSGTLDSTDGLKGQLGDLCVAAELWPSQKLRNGTAAVSAALGALLGSSPPGSVLNLYQLSEKKESMQHCSSVQLQLCANSADAGGAVSIGHRSNGSSASGPEAGSNGEPTSPNPSTPLQRGRTGGVQGSRVTPPSMRGAAASQVTPNLLGLPTAKNSTGKKSKGGQKQRSSGSEAGSADVGGRKEEINSSTQLKIAQDLLKGKFMKVTRRRH